MSHIDVPFCDFCGDDNKDVEVLIVGPEFHETGRAVTICSKCVAVCIGEIEKWRADKQRKAGLKTGGEG